MKQQQATLGPETSPQLTLEEIEAKISQYLAGQSAILAEELTRIRSKALDAEDWAVLELFANHPGLVKRLQFVREVRITSGGGFRRQRPKIVRIN